MYSKKRKAYIKPTIEIVDIEGNIGLLAESGEGENTNKPTPDYSGELGAPKRNFLYDYDSEENAEW